MEFGKYQQHANEFLKEIAVELGDAQDKNRASRVMRSVFHALRDVITPEESLHMISQLPILIKGIYVDGWKVSQPARTRSMDEFIALLQRKGDRPDVDFPDVDTAIHGVQCVLAVVQRHISAGEVEDIINQFPSELRLLWGTPV
jgi:uncharacterized protein (DUF2267 family)